MEDGKVIEKNDLSESMTTTNASTTLKFSEFPAFKAGKEYHLNLYASIKKDAKWAKKGHIVAMEQVELGNTKTIKTLAANSSSTPLALSKSATTWTVANAQFSIQFDAKQGLLTTYKVAGNSLIQQALKPNYWRAKTDNAR